MPYPQLPPPPGWMDDASCGTTTDPDRWFRAESLSNVAEREYVRAICEACAVNPQCLEYALNADVVGVWGGLTTEERRRMRRRARR